MMFKSPVSLIAYTLVVILLSSVITTAYFHLFVLNKGEGEQTLTFISAEKITQSPIKEKNTIVEVFSYGCHYCAANEKNVAGLEKQLPAGSKLIRIHLTNPEHDGLAAYASVFATLQVMGIESKLRESAYKAVIEDNINLSDANQLAKWLQQNGVDQQAWQKASGSDEQKALLAWMNDVSSFYNIQATPTFIVGKKWLAQQDTEFSQFSRQLLSLLQNDKPLDK